MFCLKAIWIFEKLSLDSEMFHFALDMKDSLKRIQNLKVKMKSPFPFYISDHKGLEFLNEFFFSNRILEEL